MSNVVILERSKLFAAALMAPKKQDYLRPYLSGVYLEIGEFTTRYTATNGAALLTCCTFFNDKNNNAPLKNDFQENLIIPIEVLSMVRKPSRTSLQFVELKKENGVYSLDDVLFKPLEDQYPGYRHVIPHKYEEKTLMHDELAFNFDYKYLAMFEKAAEILGTTCLLFKNPAEGPSLIYFGETAVVGALMPMRKGFWKLGRKGDVLPEFPEWVDNLENIAAAKAKSFEPIAA